MKIETPTKLHEILHEKNDLIVQQTRRINLLEDKLNEIRKKYFRLKAAMQLTR